MKRIMNFLYCALLLAATIAVQVDAAGQRRKARSESPAAKVVQAVSPLDQIVEQARIIVEAKGSKINTTRRAAKAELVKLVKDLTPEVKDAINDDVEIIKGITNKNKMEAQAAYERLVATANSINAQADEVLATEEGRKAVEQAPEGMKQQVIAEQLKRIQDAQATVQEASMMNRVIAGIKGALAAPGDYIFGEERTKARIAFEAAVGGLAIAGLAYGAYKLVPEGTGAGLWEKGKRLIGRQEEAPKSFNEQLEDLREQHASDVGLVKTDASLSRFEKTKQLAALNAEYDADERELRQQAKSRWTSRLTSPVKRFLFEPVQPAKEQTLWERTVDTYNRFVGRPTAVEVAREEQREAIAESYRMP